MKFILLKHLSIFVYTKCNYINYSPEKGAPATRIDRANDNFLQGKEYLLDILLLSMSNSLVLSRCTGSVAVMLLADHFENVFAFNLGRYGVISL